MTRAGVSDFIVGDLTDWVVRVIEAIGYVGVALLVALENVFPPIPSEVVLPAAGFAAGTGSASLIGMIVAATVGSVVGAWILYLVAAAIGPRRLRAFTVRSGRWVGVKPEDFDRAEAWFHDHGPTAVLVCRCVPLLRSLVSIPAGLHRMAPVTFTVYTAVGSLVWNAVLIGAGYLLGDNWETVGEYVGVLQYVVLGLIVGLVSWWIWIRIVRPRRHRTRPGRPDPDRSSR